MAKTFKKNQPIVATLPTGRVVEGFYIEPYGTDGHSFYVDEYEGERGGKPVFKKVQYGVKEEFIDAADVKTSATSDAQYKAWLKRAMILEERIKDDKKALKKATSDADKEKLQKKIERSQSKLDQINEKIDEFEGEE
jgi:predicted nuclease with TOPRIM domain